MVPLMLPLPTAVPPPQHTAVGRGMPAGEVSGPSPQFVRCAYVIILMAVYWCTEVIPLAVTSLMPAFLFPLLKILDSKQVSSPGGLPVSPPRGTLQAPFGTAWATGEPVHPARTQNM